MSNEPLRLAQLAKAARIPISSAQRAIQTLEREGLITRDRETRPRYEIAPRAPREALRQIAEWQLESADTVTLAPRGTRGAARAALPGETPNIRTSRAVAATLPAVRERLVRRFHPLRVLVFGSQARGEAREDSDVDLLVVMPDGTAKRRTAAAIYRELADLPIAKDVVVTTPAEIDRYGTLIGTVLHDALREGVPLYER